MNTTHKSESKNTVSADQVVFTSVRGPTGEGYRVIAASPGARADEKSEITRRSPSHGSLCTEAEDATGLLAFSLASGRYCIAHCRHAGKEHTARGGQRVYSHYVLLNRESYGCFGFDPTRVAEAIRIAVGDQLVLKQVQALPQLELSPRMTRARRYDTRLLDAASHVATAALAGKATIAMHDVDAVGGPELLFACLPGALRAKLAVSSGLKFSPSRQLTVSFVQRDAGETQRGLRGQPINWIDCQKLDDIPRAGSAYESWLDFARSCLRRGRTDDLGWLAESLDDNVTPERLSRVVLIMADIDAVTIADEKTLNQLASKWQSCNTATMPEQELLARFRQAIADQSSKLKNSKSNQSLVSTGI